MIKQIFRLCKLQMYNLFGINEFIHTNDKSKRKRYMLMATSWTLVTLILVGCVVGMSIGLIKLGLGDILPIYFYTFVSVLMLMFTLFKAGSILFSMKGYDMLVALPVDRAAIVVSRFMKMYISNLLLAAIVMVPGVIVYGVMENPSPLFYIIYVTGMVFLPLLPLTIASIIGAVITAISSRMRKKSIANTVLTILAMVCLFGVTMLLPKEDGEVSLEAFKGIAATLEDGISSIYPFAVWFSRAVFGEAYYLVALIGLPLVIFILFVAVLQKFFLGICTLLNGISSKKDYKIQDLKAQGVLKSLWKKELKRYFASSVYVTNTIIGYILAAVAAVSIFVMGTDKIEQVLGISGLQAVIEMVLPFIYALLMSLTSMTSCSISMEGKNIWILQTLPIKAKDVYLSKILANLIVAAPFYVVSVIMGCLTVEADIVEYVWIIVITACYIVFTAVVGITVNLAFPLFNWEDEVHAVKQSMSTLVSMIIGVLSCIVPAVLVVLTSLWKNGMVNVLRAVVVAVLVVVTLALYRRNGKKSLSV